MPLGKEVKVMQCKAENVPGVVGPLYSHPFAPGEGRMSGGQMTRSTL